ncbi:peptidoglycan-binding protein [Actinocorallia sp. API 0066]|uniref:peptidoglycan-binding protein n=1 Tax=Actinocorallia sp. API 0066 TaxID=2896846 RepID=UPI001E2F8B77|nr:peptidoglycan-binding protein [Actinocorallia sp. API 0066]MCD0453103.1 peptidoglycan-binding protein [Actinocorallia sp. API 0066]
MSRRGLLVALGTAVVGVLIVVTAVLVGVRTRSPDEAVADARPPRASPVTVEVERRVLTEPVVLRARVVAGRSTPLRPPEAATGADSVVTSVHVRRGQILREGDVVLVRSGAPMFALRLPFPLYRDITSGMKGPDVVELQRALGRTGAGTVTSGVFDAATREAVRRFYAARGFTAPTTATPDPSLSADAQRRRPSVVFERSAVLRVDRSGRRVTRVLARVGTILKDADTAVAELDAGRPRLAAVAAADQVKLLSRAQPATVVDDITGTRTRARIVSVGDRVVRSPSGGNGFLVRLAFTGAPLAPTEDRTVRVEVAVASTHAEVLAVPVTALFSRPDGTTIVTVVHGGRHTDVTVRTGATAGGWTEIAPVDGITEGTPLLVSEGGG